MEEDGHLMALSLRFLGLPTMLMLGVICASFDRRSHTATVVSAHIHTEGTRI